MEESPEGIHPDASVKAVPDPIVASPSLNERDVTDTLQQLAVAIVGVLIALAFGNMIDAVKDILNADHIVTNIHFMRALVFTGLFFLIGLDFFVGCQIYLSSKETVNIKSGTQWWTFDFISTIITLTILIYSGAAVRMPHHFIFSLIVLFGFETLWCATHVILKKPVNRSWAVWNPIMLAATTVIYFCMSFAESGRVAALLVL
ncbi:MAG TPA: hypothetical protein VFA07_18690 [Chthonomonadaceae bacterium]|nr:hypothetical protein [Chthonomonadaceae bacterium]